MMGVPCVGFYNTEKSFARYSRLCQAVPIFDGQCSDGDICRMLIEKRQQFSERPVLYATSDAFVNLILGHRDILAEHFHFHWTSSEQHQRTLDKAQMHEMCEAAGVRAPRTYVTQRDENIGAVSERIAYPSIVKPRQSFDSPFPDDRKNFVALTAGDLRDFYAQHPDSLGATLLQEIVDGSDDDIFQCTALIRRNGETGAVFCARKLRQYLPGFGVMCFGRSEGNPFVVSQTLKLLGTLNWRGFASLEFKRRRSDGEYYFIEMNPRLPWYNGLFVDAGVNLPYLAYLDLTEGSEFDGPVSHQRNGVHWVALRQDLGWLSRTRGARPISRIRWLRSLAKAQSYAWWNARDLRPGIHAMAYLLRLLVRR